MRQNPCLGMLKERCLKSKEVVRTSIGTAAKAGVDACYHALVSCLCLKERNVEDVAQLTIDEVPVV